MISWYVTTSPRTICESRPCYQEFGIDIVGEDNKTIVHHKVAARVVCVLTEQDAQAAARAEAQQNPPTYGAPGQGPGVAGGPNAFNFAGATAGGSNGMPGQPQRRTTMQPQGLMGMGGMGGGARQPGKSGLTFDHILSRLQGELQKSRETGAELHSLTGAMNEIHDTLGGNIVSSFILCFSPVFLILSSQPPNHPPYPQTLPPVVPPQPPQSSDQSNGSSSSAAAPAPRSPDSSSALAELQSQLQDTQLSLATHVEKIRTLEGMLAEHEAIKREVSAMRDMMEERRREMELIRLRTESPSQLRRHRSHVDDQSDEYSSDDDDARSISTIVPHELERVDEEDEEQIAAEEEEERLRRSHEVRPRTPEPSRMGMQEDDDEHDISSNQKASTASEPSTHLRIQSPTPTPAAVPDELVQRLVSLENQLESALELSRSLEAQHTTAQSTISLLESKVSALESLVHVTQSQVHVQAEKQQQLVQAAEAARATLVTDPAQDVRKERESLTQMISEWKKNVEGKWDGVQEEWKDERERLHRAKEEWESRVRSVEQGLESTSSKLDAGLASMASFQVLHRPQPNGHAKLSSSGGLVTPPSPRSLSAESSRPRQKKRRTSSTRGRPQSRSPSPASLPAEHYHDDASSSSSGLRRRQSWETESVESEGAPYVNGLSKAVEGEVRKNNIFQYPITPEPSLLEQPISGSSSVAASMTDTRTKEPRKDMVRITSVLCYFHFTHISFLSSNTHIIWTVPTTYQPRSG
jgi:hypothetical protein